MPIPRAVDRFTEGDKTEAGIPSRVKLEELGLGYVVKDMEPFWGKASTYHC